MTEWPTFKTCPRCSGMLWTDEETDGAWCADCEYSFEQPELDL
jgi:DNA-directed RNA polymerase subunit M/transcription elongation factor TFIIS